MSGATEENDGLKKMIDDLFTEKEIPSEPSDKDERPRPVIDHLVPKENKEAINAYIKKATEELELIRLAFLDFQESISELVVYPYVYHQIQEFGEACMDLVEVLNNDFDTGKMSDKGKKDYEKLKKLRANILSSIRQKYSKELGE